MKPMKMPALWHFYPSGAEVLALCSRGGSGMSTVGPLTWSRDQVILTEEDNDLADN